MADPTDELTFHEIQSLNDPRYDDWLDLYQMSFSLPEQVRVSSLNRMLRAVGANAAHFLTVADRSGGTVAMCLYEDAADCGAATLWYLAVAPAVRSQGTGSSVYREIHRRVFDRTRADALFLEVEDPEACEGEEARAWATRRIAFYRRLGVRRLTGIAYMQSVGWQPPVPMHLMVDLRGEQPASALLTMARCLFGDAVTAIGSPALL